MIQGNTKDCYRSSCDIVPVFSLPGVVQWKIRRRSIALDIIPGMTGDPERHAT